MKTLTIFAKCLVLSTLCFSFTSCISESNSSKSNSSMNSPVPTKVNGEANIALVQRFIDAQMQGDGETMRRLASPDFIARNPAGDSLSIDDYIERWVGINKIRANQDAGVFATNSQQVDTGPLKGNWVLFWGTYTAVDTQKDEALEVLWHADFLLENGKISRSVSYFDMIDPDESV